MKIKIKIKAVLTLCLFFLSTIELLAFENPKRSNNAGSYTKTTSIVQSKTGSVAVAIKVINDVLKNKMEKEAWSDIKRGDVLFSGDNIRTGQNSICVLSFIDGTTTKILEKTQVKITLTKAKGSNRLSEKSAQVDFGKFSFNVKNRPGEEFKFISPTSVASIKGTEGAFASYETFSSLIILEGHGELRAVEGNNVFVNARQIGTSTRTEATVRDMTEEEVEFEKSEQSEGEKGKDGGTAKKQEEQKKDELPEGKPEGIIIKIRDKNGNTIIKNIRP